jgi:hypothetical protein
VGEGTPHLVDGYTMLSGGGGSDKVGNGFGTCEVYLTV